MELHEIFNCTSCGSKEVCFGYIGSAANNFIPSGIFTVHGFRIRAYVCLHCGHVGQYIPPEKLEQLKNRFKEG